MTMSDLAEALDTSHQQVQKYETGANRISASVLYAIALKLVFPVEAFFVIPPEPDRERVFRLCAKMYRLLDGLSESDLAMASVGLEALHK